MTPAMMDFLRQHKACFKCRKPYVNHTRKTCRYDGTKGLPPNGIAEVGKLPPQDSYPNNKRGRDNNNNYGYKKQRYGQQQKTGMGWNPNPNNNGKINNLLA